tara:strand:+ start:1710 stop:3017 length:1308 start_codon:yes stop_codon:yes gene_type:complete
MVARFITNQNNQNLLSQVEDDALSPTNVFMPGNLGMQSEEDQLADAAVLAQARQNELKEKRKQRRQNFFKGMRDFSLAMQGVNPNDYDALIEAKNLERLQTRAKIDFINKLPDEQKKLYLLFGDKAVDAFIKSPTSQPTSYKEYALTDDTPTSEEYLAFLNRKESQNQTSVARFGVYDSNGNQITSVLKNDLEKIAELQDQGFLVGNLATPSGAPTSSGQKNPFDAIYDQYVATNKIINATNGLAQQYANSPTSALALGNAAKFVDSIYTNLTALGDFAREGKDNQAAQDVEKGISLSGNDFTDRIKKVSIASGVAESRVRDLAYLFAAARGQTGKGLSDKDYENALTIVSGGVGAQGKIAVLEDVANRLSEELAYDLNLAKARYSDDEKFMSEFNKLPQMQMFVNPLLQDAPSRQSQDADALIDFYLNPNNTVL